MRPSHLFFLVRHTFSMVRILSWTCFASHSHSISLYLSNISIFGHLEILRVDLERLPEDEVDYAGLALLLFSQLEAQVGDLKHKLKNL